MPIDKGKLFCTLSRLRYYKSPWVVYVVVVFSVFAIAQRSSSQGLNRDYDKRPACKEFLPSGSACKVAITIVDTSNGANPAPTHTDVVINPGTAAVIILTQASPFMSCAVVGSPAALTRDASTSFSTFIATLGTMGLAGSNPVITAAFTPAYDVSSLPESARTIEGELDDIDGALKAFDGLYQSAYKDAASARSAVINDWKYSYKDDATFKANAEALFLAVRPLFDDVLPSNDDVKSISSALAATKKDLATFATTYANQVKNDPLYSNWKTHADNRLKDAQNRSGNLPLLLQRTQVLADFEAAIKPTYEWLISNSSPFGSGTFPVDASHRYTTVYLPMAAYSQKQVTEVVTCKDVLTQTQPFDAITFTAYYEKAPIWDFFRGRGIFVTAWTAARGQFPAHSLPPRRPNPTPTAPTVLAVTSSSSFQAIPAAFAEYHPINEPCPWTAAGSRHSLIAVCSLGVAGGILINPNNGTTTAEFFEGVSFGLQRVALMIGNHTGRFQQFTGGYSIGQTVPSGTVPPTSRMWTNHIAFGITYRIPLR